MILTFVCHCVANDFFNRHVSAWNSLPSFIVNSKSVASFERSLVSVDLSKFLVYMLFRFARCAECYFTC